MKLYDIAPVGGDAVHEPFEFNVNHEGLSTELQVYGDVPPVAVKVPLNVSAWVNVPRLVVVISTGSGETTTLPVGATSV